MTSRTIALVAAMGSLAAAGTARAEEVYLCEAGRLVHVEPGALETLKKTDPCIAGYFGLKVEQSAAAPAAAPAPAKNEAGSAPRRAKLRGAQAPEPVKVQAAGKRAELNVAQKSAAPQAAAKSAAPAVAVQAPGLGYREVVILNPGRGDSVVYRHER
jgi:hypothetical protein